MKLKHLLILFTLAAAALAADLTFSDAPQSTDSATILAQRTAVGTRAVQLTPTITTATGNGTVTAGARTVTFILSSDFTGTILGAAFVGADDLSITIAAPSNNTLAAIAYTVSAGSARILKLQ